MGTNYAPLVADSLPFFNKRDFMTSFSDSNEADIIEAFNSISSYFDDLLKVSKINVGLKSLSQQGLSEPEFYSVLVYKFKKIMGRTDQFRNFIHCQKRICFDLNAMRLSAC